jgi:predicted ester cyclase
MSTPEANKATIRRLHEAFNAGNLDIIDVLFDPKWVHHSRPELTREILKKEVADYRTAVPDFHWTDEDQVAEGDKVTTRFTGVGTQTGEFMGTTPTGKKIRLSGIGIARLQDGKIVESWEEMNALELMMQFGVIPETEVRPYEAR